MGNKASQIDLVKLAIHILRHIWLVILLGAIGFAGLYWYTAYYLTDTYSASGTMFVLNGNPNVVNYQYLDTRDLDASVQLLDTYMVVVKSNKVIDAVAERLSADYPGITPDFIANTLSMGSVSKTGVLRVVSTTGNGKLSADICNAVLDVAPGEIIRVVNAGSIEIIDYAEEPLFANARNSKQKGMIGALAGAVVACGLLTLIFIMDHKIKDEKDLTDNFTPPVLAAIRRNKKDSSDPKDFLLTGGSPMEVREGYAKLRMNLVYTMAGKEKKTVAITSAVSGEGKSTIAANLAISCAKGGKKVLLIDGDLRRSRQNTIFGYEETKVGLSNVLSGQCSWEEAVTSVHAGTLSILPAGDYPPNPAELLASEAMNTLLSKLESKFDLILLDVPPINIVSDPLVVSGLVAGCLFIIRQDYSDMREVRKALISAEMMGMNVMGFVLYGDKVGQNGDYHSRKYYKNYYKYDAKSRSQSEETPIKAERRA